MKGTKMKDISSFLGRSFDDIILDMYLNREMSSLEISEEIFKISNIKITPRSIQRRLKSLGIIRSFSAAFRLAIKNGRKDYNHLRKSIKSNQLRRGVTLKVRFQVLKRDEYKCVLCGNDAKSTLLVIDHKIPVVAGGTNDLNNLRTLCRECNHGKMLLEEHHL